MANQCTKFEISNFSHSGDILGGLKIYNGSRDITMLLLGVILVTLDTPPKFKLGHVM